MTSIHVDLDEHLGKAVVRMREERGLTQAELARMAGLSKNSVSEFERGVNEPFRTFLELATIMGYTPQLELVQNK